MKPTVCTISIFLPRRCLSIRPFLCPALEPTAFTLGGRHKKSISTTTLRRQATATEASTRPVTTHTETLAVERLLPWTCPGCGAFTQSESQVDAGYYSLTRRPVKAFLARQRQARNNNDTEEKETYEQVITGADDSLLRELGLDHSPIQSPPEDVFKRQPFPGIPPSELATELTSENHIHAPVCDRCHGLLHHHSGVPIIHPTLQSIQDIISESPHKYNHIYHVLDAADFPLSLIPQLQRHLSLLPQRSQNRRSKVRKSYHGRIAEISFIITRSDLLAPKKEQVDTMLPYLVQVLRDALGSSGKNIRLGNVRCVSSKRGWWTRQLKEEVWNRGGGGWMVGKVNVGKSNLFECIFPKGREEEISFGDLRRDATRQDKANAIDKAQSLVAQGDIKRLDGQEEDTSLEYDTDVQTDRANEFSLLPPAPLETAFPAMPIVSSLPGTTASPIRLPFGHGKGELIDLPGLSRGNLEDCVEDDRKLDLVMNTRVKAKQYVVKPGQSLLVGGLVRITPVTPDLVLLACPFVPLDCHPISTDQAIAIHSQRRSSTAANIAKAGVGSQMASAGVFELEHDVTRKRAGPLTAPSAVGLKPQSLPFVIFSTDILIEGCGWIELAMQVRKKTFEDGRHLGDGSTPFPTIEVFSPGGKHVGVRRPMSAWLLGGDKPLPASRRKARPKKSMKGVKKALKLARGTSSVAHHRRVAAKVSAT
ncbi:hypothetical protein MMC20_003627 [Loxospora ochrophaea]|nr:hypothetical protein [Loxospora ochrophaea]